MAISNAFKGAYTNEVSQRNQTINTVSSGVKDLALLGLGVANVASGGALAGKMTQFVGKSLGGGAVMNLLNQKQASAQENQETKEMLSKEDVAGMLGDNPINRTAKKQLSTVFDKLAEGKQQGLINKKGEIETSLGKIDAKSELGQKILSQSNDDKKKDDVDIKQEQLDIINKYNPAPNDDYHVWIRNKEDIKSFDEVIDDEESFEWGDYSRDDAIRDLKKGTVTVYSSYPIKQGTFVSTSRRQAEDYAGGSDKKVYSATIPLEEVAWINGDEGQYAKREVK